MATRPILFSAPMIRALLDGTKTQTRRVAQVTDDSCKPGFIRPLAGVTPRRPESHVSYCPYGGPGDLLWVRETYCIEHEIDGNTPPHSDGRPTQINADAFAGDGEHAWRQPHYRATDPEPELAYEYGTCARCLAAEPHAHWKPSIHMPRWASRLTLEITDVRLQRVHEISEADARAEGAAPASISPADNGAPYVHAFRGLWDSINAARGHAWADNPFVWALSFRVVETPDRVKNPSFPPPAENRQKTTPQGG